MLTDRDRAELAAAADAEARGDARAAVQHYLAGLIVEESLRPHQLWEIADLGDDAPGWIYSRWCVDQAYRWMLLNQDPRTDDMVRVTLAVAHLDHAESLLEDPTALTEYGTLVAGTDWLAEQLCVYTAGGLLDFLDLRAEEGLLSRADRVREWASAPMRVHRLEERRGAVLVVRDLVADVASEVLDLGAFSEGDVGDHVLGRVVPISAPPHRMFDSRPVPLDPTTAEDAAAAIGRGDELGWLDAVSLAREEGRLARGFSCCQGTLWSTDLVPKPTPPHRTRDEMSGRMVELIDAGLDPLVANGVVVAEVALLAAAISGDQAFCAVGPHLTAVLVDSRIFGAVRSHCTAPEHEPAWRLLATSTTSPVHERCLELADRCRNGEAGKSSRL